MNRNHVKSGGKVSLTPQLEAWICNITRGLGIHLPLEAFQTSSRNVLSLSQAWHYLLPFAKVPFATCCPLHMRVCGSMLQLWGYWPMYSVDQQCDLPWIWCCHKAQTTSFGRRPTLRTLGLRRGPKLWSLGPGGDRMVERELECTGKKVTTINQEFEGPPLR
ncbi:hypothetical protein P7K49_020900 [Saguinus oedipus]|uniref:Uncharacterized protein n=1 Tax=Saguinus oedipus TaxID=9490 RepID=A0ABQ9UR63_SAGOE|nr:hypothetical protein P7K49_020900 [Saguinus oedipus]